MTAWLDTLLFGIYPYICLAVFFIGSLVRFDRDQYTWKSDSSQLLRTDSLRWGSNLFHTGVLVLFFGHFVGMLTPHALYEHFMSAGAMQIMAMVVGGVAGVMGIVGLTTLPSSLHHVSDPQTMLRLAAYLQGIATFQPNAALAAGVDWHFQMHMLLGMTIFLLFPFSRLVHVWSGFATVMYVFRPQQIVRARRLNVPAGQNQAR